MARKIRIEYASACYHVINRGNYRHDLFITAKARFEVVGCRPSSGPPGPGRVARVNFSGADFFRGSSARLAAQGGRAQGAEGVPANICAICEICGWFWQDWGEVSSAQGRGAVLAGFGGPGRETFFVLFFGSAHPMRPR